MKKSLLSAQRLAQWLAQPKRTDIYAGISDQNITGGLVPFYNIGASPMHPAADQNTTMGCASPLLSFSPTPGGTEHNNASFKVPDTRKNLVLLTNNTACLRWPLQLFN